MFYLIVLSGPSEAQVIGMVLGLLSDLGVMGIIRAFMVLTLAIGALLYFVKSRQ